VTVAVASRSSRTARRRWRLLRLLIGLPAAAERGVSRFYSWTPLGRTRVGAIAQQTVAEGVRMKIALVFLALIGVCVLGLPLTIQGDSTLTGAVQSYLSYALTTVGFLLAILTIFMSRTVSDELVGKQIMVLMTKPVARWQYILGKWVGICIFNAGFLTFTGFVVFGMVHYIAATHPPIEEIYGSTQMKGRADEPGAPASADRQRLQTEVLVARTATPFILPDFTEAAEAEYQQRLKEGFYDLTRDYDPQEERERLAGKAEAAWRVVQPLSRRLFQFEKVLCDRSADNEIQIRYKAEVFGYPPDEILRAEWVIGDPSKGAARYHAYTRHVIQRYQTIKVPANCVAEDQTLTVMFINRNPYANPEEYPIPEPLYPCTVQFIESAPVECLFVVGTFEGNLARLLALMMCKLTFLAALGLLATSVFSWPVACLVSLAFYALAGMQSFLTEAIDPMDTADATVFSRLADFGRAAMAGDGAAASEAFQGFFLEGVGESLGLLFYVIPNFARFNAVEVLVDGRNVSLVWVLQGIGQLVLVSTTLALGLAMLLFQRREVAEISL